MFRDSAFTKGIECQENRFFYVKHYNAGSIQLFLVQLRHLLGFSVPVVVMPVMHRNVLPYRNLLRQVGYVDPKIALS